MQQLELTLQEWFNKVPYQIPPNIRKAIVRYLPWLTLVAGVLMFFAAASSLSAIMYAQAAITYLAINNIAVWPFLWLSIIVMLVEALLYFVAFKPLKLVRKRGWDILFIVALINIVQAVVHGLSNSGASLFVSLLGATITSTIGLYLLFQIRGYYVSGEPSANVPKNNKK